MRARGAAERGCGASGLLVEAGPDYGPYDGGGWPDDLLDGRAACFLALVGDRPRGPVAAAGAGARRLLGAQRLRRDRGRTGRLRRVGRRMEPRRARAVPRRAERELRTRRFPPEELSPWHRAFAEAAGEGAFAHPANAVGPCAGTRPSPTSTRRAAAPNLTILADTLVDRVDAARRWSHTDHGGYARGHDRARRGRVRLAGDPAAQRDRAGPRARPAGRRGPRRPRRRRVRLGAERALVAEMDAFAERAPGVHGAGDGAPAAATSSSSRRSSPGGTSARPCS